MIEPHGGQLVQRHVTGPDAQALLGRAKTLPAVTLTERQLSDAHMIVQGAFSPLDGFLTSQDYQAVVRDMHLTSGLPWPLPVTLAVETEQTSHLTDGQEVALADSKGALVGVLQLEERYACDKVAEAKHVYGTQDEAHPGVANLYQQGDVLLGGRVTLFGGPSVEEDIAPHYRTPEQTRDEIASRGWNTVVGFQTRNPVHRAHEYIQKTALEIVEGLLLHPLVGETKADDIPASVRMRCYEVLLRGYYPKDRVLLSVFPAFMRYAGPREAVFHALVRKNYGCSHFIVGRDHAGVGSYYGPYDAQHIFREFDPAALGITPLFFENSFFCRQCGAMATAKTCPHGPEAQVSLSGTQVRAMLERGEVPPPEFTRPEVAQVLIEAAADSATETAR